MTEQVQTRHPHTDADIELVARAEYEHDMREAGCPDDWDEALSFVRDAYRARARAGLDALAAAGRLLPDGGRKQTQHEIDWAHRSRPEDHPTMTYDDFTEEQIDHEIAAADHLGYEPRQIRRRIITTWPDGAAFTGAWETR